MDYTALMVTAIHAALAAGRAINEVYRSDFEVAYKSDKSPLTIADQKSHEIIRSALAEHDLPLLSEEGQDTPYGQRKNWERFWLVDPLDGTKEFIKRNGEFTVNIALIENCRPLLGVIWVPDREILYFGGKPFGSFKIENKSATDGLTGRTHANETPADRLDEIITLAAALPLKKLKRSTLTIVGSRSHKNAELEAYVEEKRKAFGDVKFISAGSSLKICLVAEGRADLYPRLGPTMEWDTAAGQAIAENAAAGVYRYGTEQSLIYNKQDLHNPWFIVQR